VVEFSAARTGAGAVTTSSASWCITTQPEAPPVDLAPLVHAAGQAGLSYLQHIVAVQAHPSGDHLTPPQPDGQGPPAPAGGGAAHLRVHTDVLIFQPLAGAHARR
jgi:hypothetical protein